MQRVSSEQFVALVEAAAEVAGQPDLRAVLTTTVTLARETTGAAYAALGVIGEHGALVDFVHAGLEPARAAAIGHLPVGKGVLGTLIRDPRPIRLDRISDHPDSVGFPPHHPPMETFLGVPIRTRGRVFGNLYLSDKPGGFSDEDERLVEALAAVAGGAVASARLHDKVTRLALVEDRERIARDLHDAVIQDLFAVGLTLQAMSLSTEDSTAALRLSEAVDRIDQSIGSLRTFIFDLRSLSDVRSNPERALRRTVERIVAPHGIPASVEVTAIEGFTAERIDDALHIVREAVSNAVRHGRPGRISVTVRGDDTALRVVVEDDGIGFDIESAGRGMGLDNMASRARRTGGEVVVESSAGVGTTVSALLRP